LNIVYNRLYLLIHSDAGSSSPISQQPKRSAVSRLLSAHIDTDVDTELALEDDGTVRDVFSKTQLVVESSTTKDGMLEFTLHSL